MKYLIYIFCIFLYSCQTNNTSNTTCKKIVLNTSLAQYSIDLSNFFEKELEIIQLETVDSCLVRADDFKIPSENHIWITDRISKKIFMFDWNGKYIKTLGKVGRGPGEYVDLGGFCPINDTLLYVYDRVQSKIIIYPIFRDGFCEIPVKPTIYSSEINFLKNKLYFITNYFNKYNLISMGLENTSRNYFLPYDVNIEKKEANWSLNKYSSIYKDSMLLILPLNDTIYNISATGVFPQYVVDFPHNKLPNNSFNTKGTETLKTALTQGLIYGLDQIHHSQSFILGSFCEGYKSYNFIYSKKEGNTLLAQSFILNNFAKLTLVNYLPTNNNEIIFCYDPLLLKENWNYILSKHSFSDVSYRKKFEHLIASLNDEANPVIFKIKFKH